LAVVLLNTHDMIGGAARACNRLFRGLAATGENAVMVVREQAEGSPGIITAGSRIDGRLRAFFDGLPQHFYPRRSRHNFSAAWVPGRGLSAIAEMHPEVVHLHWVVEGFVRIEALSALKSPVIWTLHDSWPFTGGCHLPGNCRRHEGSCGFCPVLGSRHEHDLSRWVWTRKRKAWSDLDLICVAPSRWLADCARASSLLEGHRIEVIPNGIDVAVYRPGDRLAAREALGLDADRMLIVFGANHALSDPNKGADLLRAALAGLSPGERAKTELVLFGEDFGRQMPDCEMPVRNLGVIQDEKRIVQLYQAADLFAAPSRQENLPNMVMEAMACGTPCVAFAVGGLPDLISHGVEGYLAAPGDSADLGRGIAWVLEDSARRESLAARARDKIVEGFSLEGTVSRYLRLYRELQGIKEIVP
jgi:glycosyltransferase involved in cell wall biosynthesis